MILILRMQAFRNKARQIHYISIMDHNLTDLQQVYTL